MVSAFEVGVVRGQLRDECGPIGRESDLQMDC